MNAARSIRGSAMCLFFLLFLSVDTAFSQFSLISSIPNHGNTNVDTSATLSFTFNAPVDTSVYFQFPEGFFFNIFVFPDSFAGDPDSITLSPDMQTVYVHNPHLYPDLIYLFCLIDAVSQNGDSLDRPYSMIFTTGSSLPNENVSGTISYPGNDPRGTWVVLLDGPPFRETESSIVNGIVVPVSNGAYTIDYVRPGTYWPAAIKNFHIDEYGDPIIEAGTALGFYDPNGDNIADSIEVTPGSQITGIDMSLFDIFWQTARAPVPNVEALALSWAADARLVQLAAELEPDGTALFWQYAFYSPSLMQHRGWGAMGNLILVMELDTTVTDTAAIPNNWLNSDTIMSIAESNGGSQFRQLYSDAEIFGFVGHLDFGNRGHRVYKPDLSSHWKEVAFSKKAKRFSSILGADPVMVDNVRFAPIPAVWGIQYFSDSAAVELALILDALSGAVLNQPATAAAAEQQAFSLAQNWSPDARLWGIGNHLEQIDSTGRAELWACLYYSPILDSIHVVITWGAIPVYSGYPGWDPPDTLTIPAGWLDSDAAIAIAEAAGGANYRLSNQDVYVSGSLGHWYFGSNPNLIIWEFTYISSTTPPLIFIIDAYSGQIVGLDSDKSGQVPKQFALLQNFPNPFNPLTVIRYQLPQNSLVSLKVFDILGREVAVLVNKQQQPGIYEAEWDASNYSSGVYFYWLTAGNFSEVRKMLLIK